MVQGRLKMAVILNLVVVLVCLGDVSCFKITPKSNARAIKHEKYNNYREIKQNITIPVMIHMDTALDNQISKIKDFNFAPELILREVENILKGLNQRLHLKLVAFDTVNNQTLDEDEEISEYLREYCLWQESLKVKSGQPNFSVLLTGVDVYYMTQNGQKVYESTGRGYMGRMCSLHRSCAVVKWNQKDLVYLLAHEIAHSLGVYHDGTKNSCGSGFIMAAQYSRENVPQHWSTCSKTHLEEFLRNKEKSWCVNMNFENGA